MRLDTFGYVRMRSDAFGHFWKFSVKFGFSLQILRFRKVSDVFGGFRMYSDAYGCIRKLSEAFRGGRRCGYGRRRSLKTNIYGWGGLKEAGGPWPFHPSPNETNGRFREISENSLKVGEQ